MPSEAAPPPPASRGSHRAAPRTPSPHAVKRRLQRSVQAATGTPGGGGTSRHPSMESSIQATPRSEPVWSSLQRLRGPNPSWQSRPLPGRRAAWWPSWPWRCSCCRQPVLRFRAGLRGGGPQEANPPGSPAASEPPPPPPPPPAAALGRSCRLSRDRIPTTLPAKTDGCRSVLGIAVLVLGRRRRRGCPPPASLLQHRRAVTRSSRPRCGFKGHRVGPH